MALASLNGTIVFPGLVGNIANAPAVGTHATLDAAGEYASVIIAAREAMVISHVGFRAGTVSGSPTADVRIETVGTDGLPTGTLWATNTNIVTGTLSGSTFALHALTASATISAGQIFCVKIVYASGTSIVVSGITNYAPIGLSGLPYQVTNAGTPTKDRLSTTPIILALGSSTTAFYQVRGPVPAITFTSNSFNNTSSARRGLRFQVPFKCRAVGLRHWAGGGTGGYAIALFDDAGTELSSSSTVYDGDQNANLATAPSDLYFDSPVTLSPATWYRASLEPDSATNVILFTFTLPSLNYRTAYVGGPNIHYTTYVASSWTDTATDQLPLLDVLIDQLDDGASAGGAHIIGS